MSVENFSISNEKVKLRYRERYVTDGANEKSLALARGCFRGYLPRKSAVADTRIWLAVDPLSIGLDEDSFAVFANRNDGSPNYDGWSVSLRETADIALDLNGTSLLPIPGGVNYLYVYILAVYQTGATTTATYNVSDEDPSNSGSSNYDPNAILVGRIPVTPTDTTIDFDITTPAVYADVVASRKLPVPTSIQDETSLVIGDDRWGYFDSVSRWRTPTENQKLAMDNAASPSDTQPFATLGSASNIAGPLTVDLSAYGSPANGIKGIAYGPGNGVHGVGDEGFGVVGEGGDAATSSNNGGAAGVYGVGGDGDGTGDGGLGGTFEGGAGGGTGDGGAGILARGYGASAFNDFRAEGVVGVGGGGIGTGGSFYGGEDTASAATGLRGYGGTPTVGGNGATGIFGDGGDGFGATGAGGRGGLFWGGSGVGSGDGGIGLDATGGDGTVTGDGAIGVKGTGGDSNNVPGIGGVFVAGTLVASGSGQDGLQGTGGNAHTSGSGGDGVRGIGGTKIGANQGGAGGRFTGGSTDGAGVIGLGSGASAPALSGSPWGVYGKGGTDTPGGYFIGGTSDGSGVRGLGDGNGVGVLGTGTGASGTVPGAAYAAGVYGIGGGTNGHGGVFFGGGSTSYGIYVDSPNYIGGFFEPHTDYAHLRLSQKSADPTTIGNGDIWLSDEGLFSRFNSTVHPLVTTWARVNITSGTPSLVDQYNCTNPTLQDTDTTIQIDFDKDFTGTPSVCANLVSSTGNDYIVFIHGTTTTYVKLCVWDVSGGALADLGSGLWNFSVQACGEIT